MINSLGFYNQLIKIEKIFIPHEISPLLTQKTSEKMAAAAEEAVSLITPAFKDLCTKFLNWFAMRNIMQPPEFFDIKYIKFNQSFYYKTGSSENPIYSTFYMDLIMKGTKEDIKAYIQMWDEIIEENKKSSQPHLEEMVFAFGRFTLMNLIKQAVELDKTEFISPGVAEVGKENAWIDPAYIWRCLRPAEEIEAEKAAKEAAISETRNKYTTSRQRYNEIRAQIEALQKEMGQVNRQIYEAHVQASQLNIELE